ncbi:MAG: hypothetical protein ACREEE_12235, partial [Dongiaceae bacterium]
HRRVLRHRTRSHPAAARRPAETRAGPGILIYPPTVDELADHAGHALWLDPALPLRLDQL